MKRKLLLICLFMSGLFFMSCKDTSEPTSSWSEYRDGVPSYKTLSLTIPESTEKRALAITGEMSPLYINTRKITKEVNEGVMHMLSVLDNLMIHQPTEINEDNIVWGPFSTEGLSPVEWKITITKPSEATYSYKFEARPKSGGEWFSWFWGTNEKAESVTARYGKGTFSVDFEQMRKYDPAFEEKGKVIVNYDTSVNTKEISVEYVDFVGKNSKDDYALNATYLYNLSEDNSGDFTFKGISNIHEGEEQTKYPLSETWSFNTKWKKNGEGISVVIISEGDLIKQCYYSKCIDHIKISECWSDTFKNTWAKNEAFTADDVEISSEENGDESLCPSF